MHAFSGKLGAWDSVATSAAPQRSKDAGIINAPANGIIIDPITLAPDAPVGKAREMMDQHNVSGVPITEADGRLVGILTRRDLKFLERQNIPVSEVMTREGSPNGGHSPCLPSPCLPDPISAVGRP